MGSSSVDQRRRLATDGGRDSVLHATIHRGQRTNERPRLARAERATHGSSSAWNTAVDCGHGYAQKNLCHEERERERRTVR